MKCKVITLALPIALIAGVAIQPAAAVAESTSCKNAKRAYQRAERAVIKMQLAVDRQDRNMARIEKRIQAVSQRGEGIKKRLDKTRAEATKIARQIDELKTKEYIGQISRKEYNRRVRPLVSRLAKLKRKEQRLQQAGDDLWYQVYKPLVAKHEETNLKRQELRKRWERAGQRLDRQRQKVLNSC